MTEFKSPWKSTGVVGAVLTLLFLALGLAGAPVSADEQSALVALAATIAGWFGATLPDGAAAEIGRNVSTLGATAGALLALWGRITATKRIALPGV